MWSMNTQHRDGIFRSCWVSWIAVKRAARTCGTFRADIHSERADDFCLFLPELLTRLSMEPLVKALTETLCRYAVPRLVGHETGRRGWPGVCRSWSLSRSHCRPKFWSVVFRIRRQPPSDRVCCGDITDETRVSIGEVEGMLAGLWRFRSEIYARSKCINVAIRFLWYIENFYITIIEKKTLNNTNRGISLSVVLVAAYACTIRKINSLKLLKIKKNN